MLLLTFPWAMALPMVATALSAPAAQAADPSLVLVLSGASNHHWEFTSSALAQMLRESGLFRVETSDDPATALARAEGLAAIDAFVLDYNGPRWGAAAETAFLEAVRAGAGVVVVHAADNAFPGWVEYEELVGHVWREGVSGHGRVHPFDVEIVDREHPVTRGLLDIPAHPDELYHGLVAAPGHGAPRAGAGAVVRGIRRHGPARAGGLRRRVRQRAASSTRRSVTSGAAACRAATRTPTRACAT